MTRIQSAAPDFLLAATESDPEPVLWPVSYAKALAVTVDRILADVAAGVEPATIVDRYFDDIDSMAECTAIVRRMCDGLTRAITKTGVDYRRLEA